MNRAPADPLGEGLVASLEGFSHLIRPPRPLGCSVARWNQTQGFLRHGRCRGYHGFFDDSVLSSLSDQERARAEGASPRIRFRPFSALTERSSETYAVIHGENMDPARQLAFRHLLGNPRIPLVRTSYTIATLGHLREVLDVCFLERGGRPYDALVVLSKAAQSALREFVSDMAVTTAGAIRYRGRIEVVHPGIDHEALSPRDRAAARRLFDIPEPATVLLSNARIDSLTKMAYPRLLECFARLLVTVPGHDVMLVIAGADAGHEAKRIAAQIRGTPLARRVRVIADYPESHKADLLSAADMFIAFSDNLQESFGVALIEAMAAGLPVVCSDWDGFRDIVVHQRTGFLVPTQWQARISPADALQTLRHPFDHSTIHTMSRQVGIDLGLAARYVRELVESPGVRRRMGEAAKARVEEHFTLACQTRRYESLWEELGAMAASDSSDYPDAYPVMRYEYPRHFAAYPSELISNEAAASAH
ncbi:MAG: glycosyltransferase family 4 protein [Candidatus Eisenbacteria bacterium]|nr:glycosyltransferase family 4 protein [Candidatus Eisenbacteria bacterium]